MDSNPDFRFLTYEELEQRLIIAQQNLVQLNCYIRTVAKEMRRIKEDGRV